MDITVASTTDSQEEVNKAAGLPADAAGGNAITGEPEAKSGGAPLTEEKAPAAKTEEKAAEKSAEKKAEEKPVEAEKKAPETKSESGTDESEEKPQKKGGFQKRIDKLTTKTYEQAGQIKELRDRLAAAEAAAGKKPEATEAESKSTEDAKPTRAQFKSDEDFFEALGRYGARQELVKARLAERTVAVENHLKQTYDVYSAAATKFAEEHDDWEDVVGQAVEIPQSVQVAVIEMGDQGPALAYYMGTHPEFVEKLGKMSDTKAVTEIGRLAVKLEAESAAAEKTAGEKDATASEKEKVEVPPSKAPTPIKPVTPGGTQTDVPLDQLPYDKFREVRAQQEKARSRR